MENNLIFSDISSAMKMKFLDFSDVINDQKQREKFDILRREMRKSFNATRYNKTEQGWYSKAYLEYFAFMYDRSFYDLDNNRYRIEEILDEGEQEFGGYDMITLWQSYPRLGIDDRNQFDYYRELPGGIVGLRHLVDRIHARGVMVCVNYNPWDIGTRRENMPEGQVMAKFIKEINADALFLDTMFILETPKDEFLSPIGRLNPNLVFNTEGLPDPRQAESVTGSWWQIRGPLVPPPILPLIRWLEPRYSLRVIDREIGDRSQHIKVNFFHGGGQVVWENIFGWWNPWKPEDRNLLKKCVKILRSHHDAFMDPDWQPYVKTLVKGVFAHQWTAGQKTIFTLLNTTGESVAGPILPALASKGMTYYDVWSGGNVELKKQGLLATLSFRLEPDSPGCLVALPVNAPAQEGANVQNSLVAEYRQKVTVEAVKPRPVSPTSPARREDSLPGMVLIPGGRFIMHVRHNVYIEIEGACYGNVDNVYAKNHPPQYFWLKPYFMDRTEVTNDEYQAFLKNARYCPGNKVNFLKNWRRPAGHESEPWSWEYPTGKAKHPVVWIDLDDARAYTRWAGKRLPREEEWQYATQGAEFITARPFPAGQAANWKEEIFRNNPKCWPWNNAGANYRLWPWGNEYTATLCNGDSDDTTPVDKYPAGASPFGCLDMTGNVWEWTESERDDGHTRYAIIRGGSYRVNRGSCWYTASGAQPCDVHEKILLMYPGLDRCVNIGFRCVKDVIE